MVKLFFWISLIIGISGLELTPKNYNKKTSGKTAFIKFFAPWCGHCKKMAPDWEKLMKKYKKNDKIVVGEVDCVGKGKDLCDQNQVQGYPTLKYGDPDNLELYEGGRDAKTLNDFADNLGPYCSATNMDECDEESKAKIEKFLDIPEAELSNMADEGDSKIKDANEKFEAALEGIQQTYEKMEKENIESKRKLKTSGLHIMKAVLKWKTQETAKTKDTTKSEDTKPKEHEEL